MRIVLSILVFVLTRLEAQQVNFTWVKQVGGTLPSIGDNASSIAYDNQENLFICGQLAGSGDLDPGPGIMLYNSFGSTDVYVMKLDKNGNFLWARQMGGPLIDAGLSLATDAAGNVYITGHFAGTADFNSWGGGFILNSNAGGADIFITKLDGNGNHAWTKQCGGPGEDFGTSIKADPSGSIYTAGIFQSDADFDPGPGTFNLSSMTGVFDNYVLRLDANGNLVWAITAGGGGGTSSYPSIAIDNAGNAYVTGNFEGTYDFNPGPGINNLTSPLGLDMFVLKLSATGNFIWVQHMKGSSSDDFARNITLDAGGNIFVIGGFQNTVDFDPGAAVYNLTSLGDLDIFLCKLSNNGSFIWTKQMGGVGSDQGMALTTDMSGNVYAGGVFVGTGDFDPGTCVYNMTSVDNIFDAFISNLDAGGNFIWAKKIGGTAQDAIHSIVIYPSGNIYMSGYFQQTTDFDPGPAVYNLTASGSSDGFIHKMIPCTNSTGSTISVTNCRPYTVGCTTYTTSGVYTYYLQNSVGCDSIITLNLVIGNAIIGSVTTITGCRSYTWNGQTYSTSGTYKDTLISSSGCDSIITLVLTITPIVYGPVTISTSCGSYNWNGKNYSISGTYKDTLTAANGCDSIATLQLTVLPVSFKTISRSICKGQNYEGYTSTGTFIDTLTAANGCDSIRTLKLTVMPGPKPDLGNDRIICRDDSLKLSPGQFATYLWQDGSVNNYFIVKQPGSYSVTVTDSCGTATDGVLVTEGACGVWFPSGFTPNNDGKNDVFKVLGNSAFDNFQLSVYNSWGQEIFSTKDPSQGWDGSFKGQKQSTGVFAWICTFKKSNSPVTTNLKGIVTIIR
jgi:gliding motility-associated-like protein